MKKYLLSIFLFLSPFLLSAQGFTVKDLEVDIFIKEEGYFDVVENYDIYFSQQKHGIYRDIIVKYDVNNLGSEKPESRRIYIENVEVLGHKFKVSSKSQQRSDGFMRIKIGDANKYVSGDQHYEIRYRVKNGFLFYDDIVSFYWNVKPLDWQADFESIRIKIHAPDGVEISQNNTFIYSGNYGEDSQFSDFNLQYEEGKFTAVTRQGFRSVRGEAVTVLINMPRETISEIDWGPSVWQRNAWLIVLGVFLIAFGLIWLIYGKDKSVPAITTYYPPENLDPAMVGFLIDDKEDNSDLTSLIPYWASKGLINIVQHSSKNSDMELIKLQNLDSKASSYERVLFNALFKGRNRVKISSLKEKFYTTMTQAKNNLKIAASEYYFESSLKALLIVRVFSGIIGVLFTILCYSWWGNLAAIISGLVFLFIFLMAFFLKKKNQKGDELYGAIKGFKNVIKYAEIDRIKFLMEEDPEYFEKTMSYALAFGLLNQWSKKFDALGAAPPSWYSSPNMSFHSMNTFSNSLSSSMSQSKSYMVSTPSSSGSGGGGGGGFSGGGFGGGGGGSW